MTTEVKPPGDSPVFVTAKYSVTSSTDESSVTFTRSRIGAPTFAEAGRAGCDIRTVNEDRCLRHVRQATGVVDLKSNGIAPRGGVPVLRRLDPGPAGVPHPVSVPVPPNEQSRGRVVAIR